MKRPTLLTAFLVLAAFVGGFADSSGHSDNLLVTCGREEVAIIDLDRRETDGSPVKIWSWTAAGRKDFPAEYHSLFRTTDDCKPLAGGRRILITSSGRGVALVDREQDRVIFYARVTNAHSADLLPGGRVAVAASVATDGTGNAIILFDTGTPGRELWREELPSGHGIVWDESRQLLWALADQEVRAYRLAGWNGAAPHLVRVTTIPLPERGGHDLAPVPGSADLTVTTATKCWLLDRDRREVRPHPVLGSLAKVKCISQHPRTGRTAYVQAGPDHWWSPRVTLLDPSEEVPPPGGQVYKVRWLDESAGVGRGK